MSSVAIINALTVDVEDYFHVSAFEQYVQRSDWDSMESRVERNTQRLLSLFDEASVSATFFTLGWVAERHPALVRDIVAAGHELACHGYSHQLIYKQGPSVFREETSRAKQLLEDASGREVKGYRAASYSITDESAWALEILVEAGFKYDSSIVPVRHDLYGMRGAKPHPHRIRVDSGAEIIEFPPSTIEIGRVRLPIAGGGYFRLFPYRFSRWGMRRINSRDHQPFSFYMHPWEIDPQQPRLEAGWKSTFRHYNNLDKFEPRLEALLRDFEFGTMISVLDGLDTELVDFSGIANVAPARQLS